MRGRRKREVVGKAITVIYYSSQCKYTCLTYSKVKYFSNFQQNGKSEQHFQKPKNIEKVYFVLCFKASLVAQTVKNLPALREAQVLSLGQEDHWRREWQSTPVFLPREFHGQRNLLLPNTQNTQNVFTFFHCFCKFGIMPRGTSSS